jgi:hypothetical protein
MNRFHHICEICGLDEILTPDEAFEAGWNYPPRMGHFCTISDRLCPKCPSQETIWWIVMMECRSADALTDRQRAAVDRMLTEPESLMLTPEEAAEHD